MARVRLFAAAAEATGLSEFDSDAGSLGELLARLRTDDHAVRVLGVCSVLIDGVRASDPDTDVTGARVIDILPPFAGG